MPVCQIQLSFYSPADKQLFSSQLRPGLPQEDAAFTQKFPCMYNCHYQFVVSITAINVDSQMWGIS